MVETEIVQSLDADESKITVTLVSEGNSVTIDHKTLLQRSKTWNEMCDGVEWDTDDRTVTITSGYATVTQETLDAYKFYVESGLVCTLDPEVPLVKEFKNSVSPDLYQFTKTHCDTFDSTLSVIYISDFMGTLDLTHLGSAKLTESCL